MEIDYSQIQQTTKSTDDGWEAPPHVYFGRKLENGKREKEPVYVHQEYPRMMYSQKDGKITAKVVKSEAELNALGKGWEKTPAAFGYVGAPSFEQAIELQAKAA